MLSKVTQIYRDEGTDGIVRRVQSRFRVGATIKSRYGVQLASNFGDRTFKMYVRGEYGTYLWDRISTIEEPFIFLDIGANQGLYTLCAAKNQSAIKCYAFEPVSSTYDLLLKNIDLNGVGPKCEAHKLAISDQCGTTTINMSSTHSGRATIERSVGNTKAFDGKADIRTVDHEGLDDILNPDGHMIIVKVDVEGYEPVVLRELMRSKNARYIKEIFYEVDEQWVEPQSIANLLATHGFTHSQQIGTGDHYDVLASRQIM